jgi:hypothetical protein
MGGVGGSGNLPIPGTPTYVWFDPVAELQSLVAPTDIRYEQYKALVQTAASCQVITTSTFCAAAQPSSTAPALADFVSGNWIGMLTNIGLANLYSQICYKP